MKLVCKIHVKSMMGLHTRPATAIVKLLQFCKSDVSITYRNQTINAKSILSILMLAIKENSKIFVTVEGEDAAETMNKLLSLFERGFE